MTFVDWRFCCCCCCCCLLWWCVPSWFLTCAYGETGLGTAEVCFVGVVFVFGDHVFRIFAGDIFSFWCIECKPCCADAIPAERTDGEWVLFITPDAVWSSCSLSGTAQGSVSIVFVLTPSSLLSLTYNCDELCGLSTASSNLSFKFVLVVLVFRAIPPYPCSSSLEEVELSLTIFEEVFAFTFKSFSEFLNTVLLLLLVFVFICCVCRLSWERVVRLFPCAESGAFSLFATSMEAAISNADERFTPLDAFAAAWCEKRRMDIEIKEEGVSIRFSLSLWWEHRSVSTTSAHKNWKFDKNKKMRTGEWEFSVTNNTMIQTCTWHLLLSSIGVDSRLRCRIPTGPTLSFAMSTRLGEVVYFFVTTFFFFILLARQFLFPPFFSFLVVGYGSSSYTNDATIFDVYIKLWVGTFFQIQILTLCAYLWFFL